MSATLNSEEIARAIDAGEAQTVFTFLDADEIGGLNAAAFASASRELRTIALGFDITARVHGRDVERGALVAEALFILAKQCWEREPDAVRAENYGTTADLLATARQRQGRQADVAALARVVAPKIIDQTNGYRAASLATRATEALIELGDLEGAKASFDDAKRYDDRYAEVTGQRDPNLQFTASRLESALQKVIGLHDRRDPDAKARDEHAAGISAIVGALGNLPGMSPELGDLLRQAASRDQGPENAREALHRASSAMRAAAATFGLDDALLRHQLVVHEAGALLLDPAGGHDAARLRLMRERLVETQTWFAEAGHELDALDALWPIAVMSRRLNEHAEALEVMQRIRAAIERRRLGISDPLESAALFTRFPHLYANIVSSALELGRLDEALSAIEASKGRAIAELRAVREADTAAELSRETLAATASVGRLDAFLAELEVDYISFFVDDEETIGVLATQARERRFARIKIAKDRLAMLMRQVDPNGWSLFGATPLDRELAPLIAWALPHLTRPVLVISPDDPLHNLPFHYLEVPGGRLIDHVATAKMHGVDDLRVLVETPPARPLRGKVVFLPARDEGGPVAERQAAFEHLFQDLPLAVERLDGARFDRAAAAALAVPGDLLHLAAHGYWPKPRRGSRPGDAPSPYSASGLLLARYGLLPERGEPGEDDLLSPALVMESGGIDVENAVIGMQACVSGLSIEGRAGDALGLEWAFLAKGAGTVIASHWDIPFTTATAFFERLYRAWLVDGMSRAEASRHAMLALRDDPEFIAYGLEWTAFTLIGDWR